MIESEVSGFWNMLFTVAPIIASFIAIVITAFNVNEVRKQRIKMYEPILILESGNWNSEQSKEISPVLNLRNVGYGTALDMECRWILEEELVISKIFPQGLNKEFVLVRYRRLEDGKEAPTIVNKYHDFNVDFQYLMPVNIDNTHLEIRTPAMPFFKTIEHTREFVEMGRKNEDSNLLSPTKYNLEIAYKDINNKPFTKKFQVTVQYGHIDINFFEKDKKIIFQVNAIVE